MSQVPVMFDAQVNKGRIQMSGLTNALNNRWANGWYLFHIYEQSGNTVMIWASRTILGHGPPPMGPASAGMGLPMAPPPDTMMPPPPTGPPPGAPLPPPPGQ